MLLNALRTVVLSLPVRAIGLWQVFLFLAAFAHEREHPILAIAVLAPFNHYLFNLTSTLEPQISARELSPVERQNWIRIIGHAPAAPLSLRWWARLAFVVGICAAGTAALIAAYGSWDAVMQDVNSWGSKPGDWIAIAAFLGASFLIYGPFRHFSRPYVQLLGLNVARPWKALLAALTLWFWVAIVFAGAHQRIDAYCVSSTGGLCGKGSAYSQSLDSFTDALYFSTITLATVGYGDITPVVPLARIVTTLEVVFGIGLLGFLLGRVAGFAMVSSSEESLSHKRDA